MLDQVPMLRPRVALVYGEAEAAGHLRAAVADHVQIVYATAASEFDAARLADSRATAALLSLDSCDWLGAVESRLHAAGVAVVYDDPEISRTLQGWEQARWLRHLTAKLSGSTDFDPPRPASVAPAAAPAAPETAAVEPAPTVAPAPAVDVPPLPSAPDEVMEQPLSLAEIASMTVNFNAVPEPAPEAGVVVPAASAVTGAAPATEVPVLDMADAASAVGGAEPATTAPVVDVADAPAGDSQLDVDTEALSALIDARLAEAEDHAPGDAPPVWRVAHGGAVSAVELAPAVEPALEPPGRSTAAVVAAPMEDAELMQGLPAIDDWQLVDRDAPAMPAQPVAPEARGEPMTTIDFAGLELVPMEPVAQVELHTEPIERWMHVNDDKLAADKPRRTEAKEERA